MQRVVAGVRPVMFAFVWVVFVGCLATLTYVTGTLLNWWPWLLPEGAKWGVFSLAGMIAIFASAPLFVALSAPIKRDDDQ